MKSLQISQSNTGYFNCLDALVTEMSIVYHTMKKLLRIKDQLILSSIVCVYDKVIYAKAFRNKCKEPEKFQDMFLMMSMLFSRSLQ